MLLLLADTFEALSPVTITLADIEREVAARLGPFSRHTTTTATSNTVTIPTLRSTIEQEKVENLYLLWRTAPTEDDRVRLVKTHTLTSGVIQVDRTWATQPVAQEVEFHHLDPTRELRPAVLRGLRRCYFIDRTLLQPTTAATERSIIDTLPWITNRNQVYDVEQVLHGRPPRQVRWFDVVAIGGQVAIKITPDPYPSNIYITSRRNHFSFVNDLTRRHGPTLDTDYFRVDLMYAAAAGHIECWRTSKARLADVAQSGRAVTQKEAADEFTAQATDNFRPPLVARPMLSYPTSTEHLEQDEVGVP